MLNVSVVCSGLELYLNSCYTNLEEKEMLKFELCKLQCATSALVRSIVAVHLSEYHLLTRTFSTSSRYLDSFLFTTLINSQPLNIAGQHLKFFNQISPQVLSSSRHSNPQDSCLFSSSLSSLYLVLFTFSLSSSVLRPVINCSVVPWYAFLSSCFSIMILFDDFTFFLHSGILIGVDILCSTHTNVCTLATAIKREIRNQPICTDQSDNNYKSLFCLASTRRSITVLSPQKNCKVFFNHSLQGLIKFGVFTHHQEQPELLLFTSSLFLPPAQCCLSISNLHNCKVFGFIFSSPLSIIVTSHSAVGYKYSLGKGVTCVSERDKIKHSESKNIPFGLERRPSNSELNLPIWKRHAFQNKPPHVLRYIFKNMNPVNNTQEILEEIIKFWIVFNDMMEYPRDYFFHSVEIYICEQP
ncbi:hypothetical protein VP01_1585g1 [Puccinia sorghi]|uniref:Uncharacterized protein n=1 Tax=Puccinia sorghi TaxID=27349 RepID=A0A0L6VHR8_9BASI|nr:hypothetical protein VP01_1585g1 [Puccinia sorghi]